MEGIEKIEQRKIVPVAAMISAGKSELLNILYNINYLECTVGIGTKFVNLLRYNPNITEPKLYHLNLEKKGDDYIFNKDLTKEEFIGGDNIKEAIHNINEQLRAEPTINYEDLFYMTEIGESPFIKDEDYLLTHDLCDIPGLSEYQKNIKEETKEGKKEQKIEQKKDFNEIVKEGAKKFSFLSVPEKKEEDNKTDKSNANEVITKEGIEDEIYEEIKGKEEKTYLTEIFRIIKNNIDGGIIILSVENYFLKQNFKIIAKLHKVLGKEITNFLVLLNKIDLSVNPQLDIDNCKSFLIQNFQKFQAFNLNLNTFIPISLHQIHNELLMKNNYKNLINYLFYQYLSNIRKNKETRETFISHLTNIIKAITNKSREDIESEVETLNENKNIKEINQEIILIINEIKETFKTNQFILGVSEEDFDDSPKDDFLPDEIDEIAELDKINPSYILKYFYLHRKDNILLPQLSSTTNSLLNYFKYDKKPIKINIEEQKEEENILQQTKLNKIMIGHLKNLSQKLKDCKIFIDDIQKIIEDINNTINFMEVYDVIFIPFIGQPNAGKSTLINSIIGKNILPIGLNECTKRGYIIKYWNKNEDRISKAYFKKTENQGKDYYYFEEIKVIGEGEIQVRQTLNGLNQKYNNNEEDSFFFIRTKIKLFDDLNFSDYYKNMIYLIDFPGFGTGENNIFDKNEIYKKTMNICSSFIFVVRNSIIKENDNERMLNEIFTNAKEQKNILASRFIKSCLFILNNDNSQNTGEKDLEKARDEIKGLLGIKKEEIKLCFFNPHCYSNYNNNYNYFFKLDETFKNEYNNFIKYKEKLYEDPMKFKKYNSFYEYLYKIIMDKMKREKICNDKGIPKNQKIKDNCLKNIETIVEKEPFTQENFFNKYKKYIAQLISFGQENINRSEIFKGSNIEEFKKIFMAQTINVNNQIQKEMKNQIEEVISTLDSFFIENKEGDSKEVENFINKTNENKKKMILLLEDSQKEIANIKTELGDKVKQSLQKKIMVLEDLLKSKDYKEILNEINKDIKNNILELKGKFDKYLKDINNKSKELIDDAINCIKNFSIKKVNVNIISFEKYFSEKIGNENENLLDEIYEEIINSTESLGNIFSQKGFLNWLKSLFSSYNYLWNIVDMLTKTYLEKINKTIDLLGNNFNEYMKRAILNIERRVKVNVTTFTKEQLEIFNGLKDYYEKIKKEINKSLNISDNM